MEETKKYEPLRLRPCLRSYLWGGTRLRGEYHKTGEGVIAESWELSVRADGQTYIDSGEHCGESLADVLRADPVGMAGTRCGIAPFPLLIKLIDAQKDLSVQVHPSDASACREKGEQGKTEMWYVVDCKPESTLFLGFSRAVTPDELRRRAKDGTICEVLNRLVAEIQQNSDTTFRVYDYNRLGADGKPRQLHLERAAEVMNYAPMHRAADTLPPCPPDGVQEVLTCEYFRVRRAEVKTRISLATDGESFTHLMCVRGEGNILCGGKVYPFRQGDSYFLPAALGEYAVEGGGSLILSETQKPFVSDRAKLLARAYAYRARRSRAFLICADDLPVGMGLYYDEPELQSYDLSQMFIDARYQSRGYGKAAVRAILDELKADGRYDKVTLCYIEGNETARKLYESFGFVEIDRDGDEIVMQLPLKASLV